MDKWDRDITAAVVLFNLAVWFFLPVAIIETLAVSAVIYIVYWISRIGNRGNDV